MVLNLSGFTRDHLTVIRALTYEEAAEYPEAAKSLHRKSRWWLVQCACGKQKAMNAANLVHNKSRACGCLLGKNSWNRQPKGITARRIFFRQSQRWAKDRKIAWGLAFEEFLTLTSSPCYYCGQPPSVVYGEGKYNGSYTHNGIDRLDRHQGYIPGNTVAACRQCNMAKWKLTEEEFKVWIERVYQHFILGH